MAPVEELHGLPFSCDVPASEFGRVAAAATEQQRKLGEPKEEQEGFTRSISLYWHWVRGQKAASRVGKVSLRVGRLDAAVCWCRHAQRGTCRDAPPPRGNHAVR
jgi:hypothetical protein